MQRRTPATKYFEGDRVKITGSAWSAARGFKPVDSFIGQKGVLKLYQPLTKEWVVDLDQGGVILVSEDAVARVIEKAPLCGQ